MNNWKQITVPASTPLEGAINTLDKATQVKQQFDALGLSADMIPQFITMTQSFLQRLRGPKPSRRGS